ncbi:hypothetical protein DFH09DRAFT_899515, partial [Mycena vulgaris]
HGCTQVHCFIAATNGLCSSITESKHIKAVKKPYRHLNHNRLLVANQCLDKLGAA